MSFIIVSSHYNEDLQWLEDINFNVCIVHHEGGKEYNTEKFYKTYTIKNKGLEASAYLHYIIDNYDNLPDHVAFIHGHENCYHQLYKKSLLYLINNAKINEYAYIPLNNTWRAYTLHKEDMTILPNGSPFNKDHRTNNRPLMKHLNPDKNILIYDACAQFIVSKKLILDNSKEFYVKLYEELMEDTLHADMFEELWHLIFTKSCILTPNMFFNNFSQPIHFDPGLCDYNVFKSYFG